MTDESNTPLDGRLAPLGDKHRQHLGTAHQCGKECKLRIDALSCPVFRDPVPCLVGCTIKIVERGSSEMGLDYEEHAFIVVLQSGKYLIGEESIVNIDSPRFSRIRVLRDKRGNEIEGGAPNGASLLDFGEFHDNVLSKTIELNGEIGNAEGNAENQPDSAE